jgi:hypothetical protein
MGIEPTLAPLPELENKWFRAMANPKCDGRVNFRGMWDHIGIRRRAESRARAYQLQRCLAPRCFSPLAASKMISSY